MLSKLKQYYTVVLAFLGSLLGLALYFLSKKNKEIAAINAKIDLAKTEKQTDLLEAEIKGYKEEYKNLAKTDQELDKALDKIQEKREQIKEDVKNLKDPKAIAEYWEHN